MVLILLDSNRSGIKPGALHPGTAIWVAHGIAIHNHHRTYTWLTRPDVREQVEPPAREHLEGDVLFADRAELARHYRDLFPK